MISNQLEGRTDAAADAKDTYKESPVRNQAVELLMSSQITKDGAAAKANPSDLKFSNIYENPVEKAAGRAQSQVDSCSRECTKAKEFKPDYQNSTPGARQWTERAKEQRHKPLDVDQNREYTVRKGDTTWSIGERMAREDGSQKPTAKEIAENVKKLVKENPELKCNPDYLREGGKIRIPGKNVGDNKQAMKTEVKQEPVEATPRTAEATPIAERKQEPVTPVPEAGGISPTSDGLVGPDNDEAALLGPDNDAALLGPENDAALLAPDNEVSDLLGPECTEGVKNLPANPFEQLRGSYYDMKMSDVADRRLNAEVLARGFKVDVRPNADARDVVKPSPAAEQPGGWFSTSVDVSARRSREVTERPVSSFFGINPLQAKAWQGWSQSSTDQQRRDYERSRQEQDARRRQEEEAARKRAR